MDKENSDFNNYEESELKRTLFESMKKSGILDGLKSTLRTRLYDQLKAKNDPHRRSSREDADSLTYKFAVSMVVDFLQKCDMPYALSVFLPECGFSQEMLTKEELVEIMKMKGPRTEMPSPMLFDIVDEIRAGTSIRPNHISCEIQTEEAGESAMSLDAKLKSIDFKMMEKSHSIMPHKLHE